MEDKYIIKSLDDGYGDIKFDGRGEPSLIPSFVTSFKEKPDSEFDKDSKLQYLACEVDGQQYVVGDYAIKLDPDIRWIGGEKKHDDTRFPILLKTALGLMCPGSYEVVDTLMMNLPIKYDTEERRRALTKIAQGTHLIDISHDGKNFINKMITVEHVDIKKQPFGSICDLVLDESGNLSNREVAKGFNVVVDVGARTLNILTVDGLVEQPELSIQTNDGMFTAYKQVGSHLETSLGATIPDGKYPQIIAAREFKGRNIDPLIEAAYAAQSNNIMNVLDKVLINAWAFVQCIVFTGGGSELLKPYLLPRVPNNVEAVVLDRYANARGLRKYGIRQAKKNIKRADRYGS
ncbi:chaperone protein DNAK [Bacillus phage SDFMU_Pbc]|uniref:Chaperone protein DNAK n=1 Tax=Bacillus phage SDFMU_Pbc TaxID=3076135 RepID=A0AA96KRB7_9CAUD|nr:chaperone protein DNAK [Bacillus phage SDFMU_Pbc]